MVSNSYLFTDKAIEDLDNTLAYIKDELCNPLAAKKLFDSIINTIDKICAFPKSYPIVDNELINNKEIRKAIINNYLLYYLYQEDKHLVTILCLIRERRNISEIINRI